MAQKSSQLIKYGGLFVGGVCLLFQTGCFLPVAIMGGATAVATSAAEERGVGGVISDTEIKGRVKFKMSQYSSDLLSVDVVVRQGRVLLTGIVAKPEMQIDAVRLAWQVDGVKEVLDELQVGDSEDIGTIASDTWITTRLKSSLVFSEEAQSINYNIHTINGVVYLMGIAQTQKELDFVIHKARTLSGVKKVVSYVTLKQQPVTLNDMPAASSLEHSPQPRSSVRSSKKEEPLSLKQSSKAEPPLEDPIELQDLDQPNHQSSF